EPSSDSELSRYFPPSTMSNCSTTPNDLAPTAFKSDCYLRWSDRPWEGRPAKIGLNRCPVFQARDRSFKHVHQPEKCGDASAMPHHLNLSSTSKASSTTLAFLTPPTRSASFFASTRSLAEISIHWPRRGRGGSRSFRLMMATSETETAIPWSFSALITSLG